MPIIHLHSSNHVVGRWKLGKIRWAQPHAKVDWVADIMRISLNILERPGFFDRISYIRMFPPCHLWGSSLNLSMSTNLKNSRSLRLTLALIIPFALIYYLYSWNQTPTLVSSPTTTQSFETTTGAGGSASISVAPKGPSTSDIVILLLPLHLFTLFQTRSGIPPNSIIYQKTSANGPAAGQEKIHRSAKNCWLIDRLKHSFALIISKRDRISSKSMKPYQSRSYVQTCSATWLFSPKAEFGAI